MTAFAGAQKGQFSWEIRSVNQRFTDISFRMPEAYRVLEPALRKAIKARVHRGKLECTLRVEASQQAGFEVDPELVAAITAAARQVADITGGHATLGTAELLRWPGVIKGNTADIETEHADILAAFAGAVDALIDMRENEGAALADIIREQLSQLLSFVTAITAATPAIATHQRTRLLARLEDIGADVNQERFEQELVFLLQKSDIQEELDRLRAHVEQIEKALASDEPIGRRLDFLIQELNREANTLSAKATAADTSLQAVDMKVVIEQMREQVQNIE